MTVDLRTHYLGFELPTPLVASAGPHTGTVESLLRLEEHGISAVVLPSLFEEQIVAESLAVDALMSAGASLSPEATGFLPELDDVGAGPHRHLRLVTEAKQRLTVPVIASLNGVDLGGWVRYARELQDAGADAIELNLYGVIADPDETAAEVEQRNVDLVAAVRSEISVPLAVKIGPWYTAPANFCRALVAAGADGLVLFNRFYQPDIDVRLLEVRPRLQLSTSSELRLALHWIGILRGRMDVSLAATSGVETPDDVVRAVLAGADVVMTTSAVLRHGASHLRVLQRGLEAWMEEQEYRSVAEMKGSLSQRNVPNPDAYERANYMQVLHSWSAPIPS
jgi:dihydroorotate dehydrogenase (fumarate)